MKIMLDTDEIRNWLRDAYQTGLDQGEMIGVFKGAGSTLKHTPMDPQHLMGMTMLGFEEKRNG